MKPVKVSAFRERGLRPGARAPVDAILFSLGRWMLIVLCSSSVRVLPAYWLRANHDE